MTCPMCCGDTQVTYTYDKSDHVVRDRKCRECGYRFQTLELDEDYHRRTEDNSETKKLVTAIREIAVQLSNLGDKYD